MVLLGINCVLAVVLGVLVPLRWHLWGYLGGALLLFAFQAGVNTASGFAGADWEESLLLFNGSLTSYVGFNLQVTYRAFAPVLLALAVPLVFRFGRALGDKGWQ